MCIRGNEYDSRLDSSCAYNRMISVKPCSMAGFSLLILLSTIGLRRAEFRAHQTNGSEFAWEFERAVARLGIQRYSSRVKTPKDNPEIERFNGTLEYEWLYDSNLSLDPEELNPWLTEWLIEYNFNRPHQSLAYLTPIQYIERELAQIRSPVLLMWSASTLH